MTNKNQSVDVIIKFTIYVDEQISMLSRSYKTNCDVLEGVMGYKRAVDDLLGGDVLNYVYKQFITFYVGQPEARKDAREYFKNTARMYKDLM